MVACFDVVHATISPCGLSNAINRPEAWLKIRVNFPVRLKFQIGVRVLSRCSRYRRYRPGHSGTERNGQRQAGADAAGYRDAQEWRRGSLHGSDAGRNRQQYDRRFGSMERRLNALEPRLMRRSGVDPPEEKSEL